LMNALTIILYAYYLRREVEVVLEIYAKELYNQVDCIGYVCKKVIQLLVDH
jgi:hypothetical protein